MTHYNIELPFSTAFTVHTDLNIVIKLLSLYYGHYFVSSNYTHALQLKIASNNHGGYRIEFNGQIYNEQYFMKTVSHLIYQNTVYSDEIIALHGAAVELNESAYVFLAPTTGGKSTLCSFLVNKDCGYITDDCVLIDRTNMCIHPCTKPLHIRPSSFKILLDNGIEFNKHGFLNDGETRRYVYTPEIRVGKPLPIKRIYFLSRNMEKNEIIPITFVERSMLFLKSSMTVNFNVNYLNAISKVSKLPCYHLFYKDMDFVYDCIKNEKEYF